MDISYDGRRWKGTTVRSIVFSVFLLFHMLHVIAGEITPEECQFGSFDTYIEVATYIEQWSTLHPYNTTKIFCSKNPICKYRYTPLVMGYIPSGVDIVFDKSRDNLVHACGYLHNRVCCNGSCATDSMVTTQSCQQATVQQSNVYIAILIAVSVFTISVVMNMEDIPTTVDNMLPMYKKGLSTPDPVANETKHKTTMFSPNKSNRQSVPPKAKSTSSKRPTFRKL